MSAATDRVIANMHEEFAGFAGRAGVAATNLVTGEEIRVNADEETATASTIKVPILIALFRQVEAGTVALDDKLTYTAKSRVPGSGILRDLLPGIVLSVENLAILMIIVSDNSATNLLIDLVGLERVNQTMAELGFPRTRLRRRLDFAEIGQDARGLAVTTAGELAGIMAALATGAILTPASCEAILEIMRKQHFTNLVPRYLPYSPYAKELDQPDNGLRIATKTGGWTDMRADMSLVEWPAEGGLARYVIGISIEHSPDTRFWSENTGDQLIGRVSRLIFDHFGGGILDTTAGAASEQSAATAQAVP
ncbi:MAG: class A beta-lactamase-related serine hydrolase [Chloroflexota bacterium]|nr:class A beta-lactamase-related serine hydrolase [Chloroflexota bacterium]